MKHTFPKILLNCLKNSPPEKLNGFGILKTFLQEFKRNLLHNFNLPIKLLFLYFFNRRSYISCLLSFISFQISGSIEVKEKVQLLQTSVKNGTNGNTNGNMGYQVSKHSVLERIWIKGSYLSQWLPQGERGPPKESKSRWIEILQDRG